MANPRATRIGELLVKAKLLDQLQLRAALAQHDAWGGRLATVVTEMGLASEDKIVEALASALGVQRIRLGNIQKDPAALAKLEVKFAEQHGVFPVQLRDNGKVLLLAMSDPTDLDTADEVNRRARARVVTYIAGEREIRTAIARHYRGMDAGLAPERTPTHELETAGDDEGDDFKIVDMSGKTVMKKLADIDPELAKQEQSARSAPPVAAVGSAADMLDDILGGGGAQAVDALSPEDLQRLHTVQVNQEKSAKIIRAVGELLAEKGYLSPEQLRKLLR